MPSNDNDHDDQSLLEQFRRIRANADRDREPELLASRMGTRMVSLAALLERIVSAFVDEHAGGTDALRAADTEAKRLKLLLGTVDYVLAVESVSISEDDKAEIMRRAYAELFTYGPLDALFADEGITTISLEGADKVFVRYGHGELTALKPLFDDESHLRGILRRLLLDAGADLTPEQPIIEAGLTVGDRPVCVSVAAPPVTINLSADIRVHPSRLPVLEDMIAAGFVSAQAAKLLNALARSAHGVVIVGDTESGKTTLLAVLAALAPEKQNIVAIERAGELHLPHEAVRLVVRWPSADHPGVTFGEQISAALEKNPSLLLLDEVRADEADSVTALLGEGEIPRQMWAFRGPADSKRLISALGMLARRSDPARGEAPVLALYERLPFVVTVRRRRGGIQLHSISEWQFSVGTEYPDFVELMAVDWEGIALTGKRPRLPLELPDSFWD
jgi:Flp pilus assembly CpaF family ATPase